MEWIVAPLVLPDLCMVGFEEFVFSYADWSKALEGICYPMSPALGILFALNDPETEHCWKEGEALNTAGSVPGGANGLRVAWLPGVQVNLFQIFQFFLRLCVPLEGVPFGSYTFSCMNTKRLVNRFIRIHHLYGWNGLEHSAAPLPVHCPLVLAFCAAPPYHFQMGSSFSSSSCSTCFCCLWTVFGFARGTGPVFLSIYRPEVWVPLFNHRVNFWVSPPNASLSSWGIASLRVAYIALVLQYVVSSLE